jgi:hypothetical protein
MCTAISHRSVRSLPRLIDAFERTTLPRGQWNHAAHLLVALWYFNEYPEEVALERLRVGIERYNRSVGSRGYHETLTRFWAEQVRRFLEGSDHAEPLAERAAQLVEELGDSRLPWSYYSAERLASDDAKRQWLEPDLRPLD